MNFNFILFFGLFINIFGQIPIWDFEKSSVDLLSSGPYNYIIYDETKDDLHIKLEKSIEKKNGKIVQKNLIQKNNEEKEEVDFEDIYDFYSLEDTDYICPKGNNHLINYTYNEINEVKNPEVEIDNNWSFTCSQYNNRILMSYLGANDNIIYVLNQNKWEEFRLCDGFIFLLVNYDFYNYYDIIWPNENSNYGVTLFLDKEGIQLAKFSILFNSKALSISEILLINNDIKGNTSAYFDEDRYIYWISYDDKELKSGYSINHISDDFSNFRLFYTLRLIENKNSPFSSMENVTINNVTLIRNTKYAYYQIEFNSTTYYGVIDIRKNQIIFNTDEEIKEFKPLSPYSLLAIKDSSAYEICINGKSNGKCISECPRGKDLIIDNENGNYCNGTESCKILLMPDNVCVDKCDEHYYIQIGNVCGLCKDLNKTFPYKIAEEDFCLKEKPINSFFDDESSYILKYCHASCETCYEKKRNQCLSCKRSSFLIEGRCEPECPDGYYGNKTNNKCLKCDPNCRTCSNGKENSNNHCLTCNRRNYLVNATGFDSNCVRRCPNNTKFDNKTRQCLGINDDKDKDKDKDKDSDKNKDQDKDKNNNNENNNTTNDNNNNQNQNGNPENFSQNSSNTWIWVLVIILSLIIIGIVGFIIYQKFCKKKTEDDVNVEIEPEDDFMISQNQNDSIADE